MATKAAHTPGPWAAVREQEHKPNRPAIPYFSINTDTANQVGDKYASYIGRVDGARGERQEANARLIAAAPDMLEALERIESSLYNPFEPDNQSANYLAVKAAIQKAHTQSSDRGQQ